MAYEWKRQMTAADVIRQLLANGWVEVRQEGSHRHFKKNGRLCPVPDHGRKSLLDGTLGNIKRLVRRAEEAADAAN